VHTVLRAIPQHRLRHLSRSLASPIALTVAASTEARTVDGLKILARAGEDFIGGGAGSLDNLAHVHFLVDLVDKGMHGCPQQQS
jgi:hypothetical protein